MGPKSKLRLDLVEDRSNQFQEGETVLALYGKDWYEAKILQCYRDLDKNLEPCYLVHYNGWSKKTDELVPEDRLQKKSDENAGLAMTVKDLKMQKKKKPRNISESTAGKLPSGSEAGDGSGAEGDYDLAKLNVGNQSPQIGIIPTSPNIASSPGLTEGSGSIIVTVGKNPIVLAPVPAGVKSRTRSRSRSVNTKARKVAEETPPAPAPQQVEVKPEPVETTLIHMSKTLKQFLYFNYQDIAAKSVAELPMLPYDPSVQSIFDDYAECLGHSPYVTDFLKGLKNGFNFYALEKTMYESERQQLAEIHPTVEELPEMASLYGLPHLLRFFSILEPILVVDFPVECIPILMKPINKFLEFIDANSARYCRIPTTSIDSTNATAETANIADTTSAAGNIPA